MRQPPPRHLKPTAIVSAMHAQSMRLYRSSLGAGWSRCLRSRGLGLLFTCRRAQWRRCERSGCCRHDLFLVGHDPLECSAGPSLILLSQIKVCLVSAHTLCSLAPSVSSDTAPVEPAIRKRLHVVQKLSLVFPKPARTFSKRGRHFGTRQKHLLHVAPLFSEIRGFHGYLPRLFERVNLSR